MATSSKKISIIAVGAVILAAIAYFGVTYPPGSDDMAGTIAPAERYRASQPTSEEIQLGDQALQEVMQTDAFDRLVNDEAFQEAMQNEAFREALSNEAFVEALTNEALQEALAPTSRSTVPLPLSVGKIPARAGRSTDGSVPRMSLAVAMTAPVLPALTSPCALPSRTRRAATLTDESRLRRTA